MKRKILKDRNLPPSEQINAHQDFDRLNKDYTIIKKLMMKKIIIWSGAIACIAGIAGLIYMNVNSISDVESKMETKAVSKVETCIQAPIPGKETPYSVYRISAKNGGVIHHATGSSITIPPNAFSNKNGTPLSDSVEIKYREFHDPLDIFLSGIPMKYDSAGIVKTLESAGMIEILASDRDENLVLDEHNPIQIRMASANSEERFNLYELDTINKNWVYKGKDKIEALQKSETVQKANNIKQVVGPVDYVIKPAMADPEKYSFRIGYDKKEFPELAAYENVLFEVTDNSFKPAYYKINWNKISLYSGNEAGHYTLKLKKADTTISVTAKPVFDKENYTHAMAQFEERHKASAMDRDQKELDKQAALNKVNKELSFNGNNVLSAALNRAGLRSYRNFPVTRMGFHNIDFPVPDIEEYAFSFRRAGEIKKANSNKSELAYSTIFLIEKGKNTVFRFSKGEAVKCNPNAKNLMWTVTDQSELAFFRISDYTKLANRAENNVTPVVAKSQELAFEEIKKFSE